MIWRREQFLSHMNFEYTGREMFCELFGPLRQLEYEWGNQGATPDEIGMAAFDWDYVLKAALPVHTGAVTDIKPRVLEDSPDRQIGVDTYGRRTMLFKNSATIALPLTYPVANTDDWLKVKHWYEFSESRINRTALDHVKKLRENGYLTLAGIPGGFDEPRQLMGEEALCVAYYENAELIYDILSTIANTCLKVFERVVDVCGLDCLCIHEDLAGKSGSLIGPKQIEVFLKPYYRRIWDSLASSGCGMFSMDSDGNINSVLEAFLDCGVNSVHPFEPMAGMDMVKSRLKYGSRFSIKGGIDKFALLKDRQAIRCELEYKMKGATRGGGVVFGLDHRIPNGVSLENYKYYVNTGREILGLPPVSSSGWERMAF